MNRIGLWISSLLVVFALLSSTLFVVDQRQFGVVYALGQIKEVITEPGLHRLTDGRLDAVAAAGSADAREMNYRINAAKRFDIDISGLGIPLDFIWCNNRSTHKTLNCMAFTLEVTNECGSDKP